MRTNWIALNYIANGFSLTKADIEKCSHSGDCEMDVKEVLQKKYVQRQLKAIDPEAIRKELEETGAWDAEQLSYMDENKVRFVWVVANNLSDELFSRKRK